MMIQASNRDDTPPASMPIGGLRAYRSAKVVYAGEIVDVQPEGCMVRHADGSVVYHPYEPHMTTCIKPVTGDYWLQHDDGHQALLPCWAFAAGYVAEPTELDTRPPPPECGW